MRSAFLILVMTLLAASAIAFAEYDGSPVTGTVIHPSVRSNPTVVSVVPFRGVSGNFNPPATPLTLELKRGGFSPAVLPVLAGATVRIVESHAKNAEAITKTFDEPGTHVQLCSRHPEHVAYVVVLETPYFSVADSNGKFEIGGVPSGSWKLKVWNQELALSQTRHAYDVLVTAGKEVRVEVAVPPLADIGKFWLEPRPVKATLVEQGAWMYRQRGCFLCHGENGVGGVRNPNYVKGSIPALDTIAEKLLLFEPEDARLIVEQLERGRNLETLRDDPPLPRYEAFLAQYASVRDVILKGNPAGKLHPKGPKPPLDMPRSKDLSKSDIDALIAYLLTLQGSAEKP